MRYADVFCKYHETYEDGNQYYVYSGVCIISGKEVSVKIPAKELSEYRRGLPIQEAMRSVSADDREFLISGIAGDEYDKMFAEDD
jgi:hypothetical protein